MASYSAVYTKMCVNLSWSTWYLLKCGAFLSSMTSISSAISSMNRGWYLPPSVISSGNWTSIAVDLRNLQRKWHNSYSQNLGWIRPKIGARNCDGMPIKMLTFRLYVKQTLLSDPIRCQRHETPTKIHKVPVPMSAIDIPACERHEHCCSNCKFTYCLRILFV